MNISIERVESNTNAFRAYCRLRNQFWPMGEDVCEREAAEIVASSRWAVFVARLASGEIVGFLEAGVRDYAEGAESSPVGHLEGVYLLAEHRRQGIGAALVRSGEQWAWSQGCTEIEVERQVCFIKRRA